MRGKIKHIKQTMILLCIVTLAYSCKKEGCPLSPGSISSETRNVLPFTEIRLYDKINLVVTQDSVQQIIVEAGKNFMARIGTDVENNILTIKNNNKCNIFINPGYEINVYISANQLQKIDYYGSGNISSTNTLYVPTFTIDSWDGTGSIKLSLLTGQANAIVRNNNADITISGRSDNTYVYCADVGSVNLVDFISTQVSIVQKSIRDVYVNVTGSLQANVLYKGNVFYKGMPSTIDTLITSTGKLIHL